MAPVVVVGAGHNGLVCAAYLARSGLDVLVLEARDTVGGCASTVDALDGARVNICNCDHTMVRSTPIAQELGLAAHGLRYLDVDPTGIALSWEPDRVPWVQFRDPARTLDVLAATHPGQVAGYRRYLADALPVARLLLELTSGPPTVGSVLRRLVRLGRGSAALPRLLGWSRRSVTDVLGRYLSDEALLAAAFAVGPAVWGVAPDTPGTGLGAAGMATRHLVGVGRPVGGSGALPDALRAALEAAGGTVRTAATVDRIEVERDRVLGVRLVGGELVAATTVICSTDPRATLVGWLGHAPAGAELSRRWRARPVRDGYESKVDAVVEELPVPRALDLLPAAVGAIDPNIPTTTVAPATLAEITAAHGGATAERPMFLVNTPSVLDPSMRPSPDEHVFSLEVLWTPYGGRHDPRAWLDGYSGLVQPGFGRAFDSGRWRAVTPEDYERDFGMPRGYAPSFAGGPLAALVGRDRELTRYETPVRGLYLTGAGTFPGAGVWGAAGRNAAAVVIAGQ